MNCCVTRASTLGGDDKNKFPLYFIGSDINYERFHNMTHSVDGMMYDKVQLHEKWIHNLIKKLK